MRAAKLSPDVATYTLLIWGHVNAKEHTRAAAIHRQMRAAGFELQPDAPASYALLFVVVCVCV